MEIRFEDMNGKSFFYKTNEPEEKDFKTLKKRVRECMAEKCFADMVGKDAVLVIDANDNAIMFGSRESLFMSVEK